MANFDLPLEDLQAYQPERSEAADFDAFWEDTLATSRAKATAPDLTPYTPPLKTVDVFDVSFSGFDGQRVKAWLVQPADVTGPLPCVVEYIGYGGGRGFPSQRLLWSAAGFAHFVVDNRGQSAADTPDIDTFGVVPHVPGYLTRGIESPETHFYRRLMTDAVLAVDTVAALPQVDESRIALIGGSQGGGLALAVAGLHDRPIAAVVDVPFLCGYRRAASLVETAPYVELSRYLALRKADEERFFEVLSYFDGINFAPRARAKALFSVALFDDVCPPSTVYAAYNHYAGPKSMTVFPFNHHEGGGVRHDEERLAFLAATLG